MISIPKLIHARLIVLHLLFLLVILPAWVSLSVRLKVKVKSLSPVRLFATPWTVACTRLLHPWDFLVESTGVGCHFLLRGIFPPQGSNSGLPHCRQTLYRLSHKGSPSVSLGILYSILLPMPYLISHQVLLICNYLSDHFWLFVLCQFPNYHFASEVSG